MAEDDRMFVTYWKLGGKWEARVKVDADVVHIGYFSTEEEAKRKCFEVSGAVFNCYLQVTCLLARSDIKFFPVILFRFCDE
jgi:hypothetical protein